MSDNQLNSYLELSTLFYDTIRPAPPNDGYQFYRNYIAKTNGKILEPMCGSGRYLIPYLKEGFMIDGFDASPFMLEKLKYKLLEQRLNARVWEAFCDVPLPENNYQLIFIPSGSFGHIIEIENVKESLTNFYNALDKNGVLIFEAETKNALPKSLNNNITQEVGINEGQLIKLNRTIKVNDEIVTCTDLYELYKNKELIKSEAELFCVRLYNNPDTLTDILKKTGFRSIKLMKAYEVNKVPSLEDASIIYECIK